MICHHGVNREKWGLAYVLSELVRNKPCYGLIHNLRLVVNTLYRKEDFAERACVHDIQLPLSSQARAVLNQGRRDSVF